jgi:hypothetical protein
MSDVLRPRAGFNWGQVSWGGPDETPTDTCSYCDAPLDDSDGPLILWNAAGWRAQFCDACMETW